jgi:hypothetical protein
MGTVCTAATRQLAAVEKLLDDEVETLRAQRNEALELASIRLHVNMHQTSSPAFKHRILGLARQKLFGQAHHLALFSNSLKPSF